LGTAGKDLAVGQGDLDRMGGWHGWMEQEIAGGPVGRAAVPRSPPTRDEADRLVNAGESDRRG
jgi:hypothetical protein